MSHASRKDAVEGLAALWFSDATEEARSMNFRHLTALHDLSGNRMQTWVRYVEGCLRAQGFFYIDPAVLTLVDAEHADYERKRNSLINQADDSSWLILAGFDFHFVKTILVQLAEAKEQFLKELKESET